MSVVLVIGDEGFRLYLVLLAMMRSAHLHSEKSGDHMYYYAQIGKRRRTFWSFIYVQLSMCCVVFLWCDVR